MPRGSASWQNNFGAWGHPLVLDCEIKSWPPCSETRRKVPDERGPRTAVQALRLFKPFPQHFLSTAPFRCTTWLLRRAPQAGEIVQRFAPLLAAPLATWAFGGAWPSRLLRDGRHKTPLPSAIGPQCEVCARYFDTHPH